MRKELGMGRGGPKSGSDSRACKKTINPPVASVQVPINPELTLGRCIWWLVGWFVRYMWHGRIPRGTAAIANLRLYYRGNRSICALNCRVHDSGQPPACMTPESCSAMWNNPRET